MVDIDYIMSLIDWNNCEQEQKEGIRLAQNVNCINAFLRPHDRIYNKNVWDNCAKILSERSDEELEAYLIELLEWLQDMNWPGAFCIRDRLQKYSDNNSLYNAINVCIEKAKDCSDEVWESNLYSLLQKKKSLT